MKILGVNFRNRIRWRTVWERWVNGGHHEDVSPKVSFWENAKRACDGWGKSKGDNTFAASNCKTHTLLSYSDLVSGGKYKNKKLFEWYFGKPNFFRGQPASPKLKQWEYLDYWAQILNWKLSAHQSWLILVLLNGSIRRALAIQYLRKALGT